MLHNLSLLSADNPSITFDANPVSLFVDGSHILNCYVRGLPSPVVKWKRNGREISHGDLNGTVSISGMANAILTTVKLHFSKVGREHDGNYTCEAQNKYNTRRRNVTILVSCKDLLAVLEPIPGVGHDARFYTRDKKAKQIVMPMNLSGNCFLLQIKIGWLNSFCKLQYSLQIFVRFPLQL